jgi:hypothetical protein
MPVNREEEMTLLRVFLVAAFAIVSVNAANAKRCPKGFTYDPERDVCVRIPTGSY